MLWTASSVLQWPSKWCLSYDSSFLPLLFSGVMWMSKVTSLPALLPKNIEKLSCRPVCLKGHQPCNEFTGCVLFKLYISVRQPKFYFPKVETLDAQRKPLGRLCFASRTTCWKDQQKNVHCLFLLTNPCQHLSQPSAESSGLFFTSLWWRADFWKLY